MRKITDDGLVIDIVYGKNTFEVTWGEGYPPTPKQLISLEELTTDSEGSWNLSDEFIQQLRASEVDEVVTYSDPSGDVFFERTSKMEFEVTVTTTTSERYFVTANDSEEAEDFVAYNRHDLEPDYINKDGDETYDTEEIE